MGILKEPCFPIFGHLNFWLFSILIIFAIIIVYLLFLYTFHLIYIASGINHTLQCLGLMPG